MGDTAGKAFAGEGVRQGGVGSCAVGAGCGSWNANRAWERTDIASVVLCIEAKPSLTGTTDVIFTAGGTP